MRILRVEHRETKRGPYHTWWYSHRELSHEQARQLEEVVRRTARHPEPCEDRHLGKIWKPRSVWYCGFASLEQYDKWFDRKCQINLHRLNFHVIEYGISENHVHIGTMQLIFNSTVDKKFVIAHSCLLDHPHPLPTVCPSY